MTLYPPGYSQLVYRIKTTLAQRKRTPIVAIKKWKITRGDKVQIISGRGRGGQGIVKRVLRHKNRLVVEGQALVKDTRKPTETTKGSFLIREQAVHYSNVQLIDPTTGKPTKMRYAFLEDGAKVRLASKSGAIIPKPSILKIMGPRTFNAATDTDPASVLKTTYVAPEWEFVNGRIRLRTASGHNPSGPIATPVSADSSSAGVKPKASAAE